MAEMLGFDEVYLQPGEVCFASGRTRLKTLLGSCVAVTFWHPRSGVGGMCHYMLPRRTRERGGKLDGRYGEEAVALMLMEIGRANTDPSEYEVKLFGGGNMFTSDAVSRYKNSVSKTNVAYAREVVEQYGLKLKSSDLGGHGYRQIRFDVWSGDVWVRRDKKALALSDRGTERKSE